MKAILSMLFALGLATTAIAQPVGHYVNTRFHYSVDYPTDLLRPNEEAPNGDGRSFAVLLPTRADVRIWGGYNVQNRRPADFARDMDETCGGRPGYRVVRPDLVAASCRVGQTIHYRKTLIRGDRTVTLSAQYLVGDRARLDRAVQVMANSLRVLAP